MDVTGDDDIFGDGAGFPAVLEPLSAAPPPQPPGGKEGNKKRASDSVRKWCRACKDWSDDVSGTKAFCRSHQKEINAIDKLATSKGQTQFWTLIKANDQHLFEFMTRWQRVVSAPKGRGGRRTGSWDWCRYKASFYRRLGKRAVSGSEQVTETEFVTRMTQKGRTAAWAQEEWSRRRADPDVEKGIDGDTGLPTVAVRLNKRDEEYVDEGLEDTFEVGEKEKKAPKPEFVDAALRQLSDRGPVPAKLAAAAGSGDFCGAMAGLVGSIVASSGGPMTKGEVDFQQFVDDKGGVDHRASESLACITPDSKRGGGGEAFNDGSSAAGESGQKGKRFFSSDDDIPKYQQRVRGIIAARRSALEKAIEAGVDAMSGLPAADEADHDRYLEFSSLLEIRLACARQLLSSEEGEWNEYAARRRKLYDAGVQSKSLAPADRLPCTIEVFEALRPLVAASAQAVSMFVGCDNFETCDLELSEFEDVWGAPIGTIVALVKKAVGNVVATKRSVAAEAQRKNKAAAKASAKAGADEVSKNAVAHAEAEASKGTGSRVTYKAMSHDWARVPPVSTAADGAWAAPVHLPAMKDVEALALTAPCHLNLQVFNTVCRREFAQAGGPTRKVHELTGVATVRARLIEMLQMPAAPPLLKECAELSRVTVFGLAEKAHYVGVEPFGTGSLRAYTHGEARLGLVSFSSCKAFLSSRYQDMGKVTVSKIRAFLRTVDMGDWAEFTKSTDLQMAMVASPCIVYIPAGWLVVELAVNGAAYGLATALVAEKASQTFMELVALSDELSAGAGTAHGSQLAIMRQVRDATKPQPNEVEKVEKGEKVAKPNAEEPPAEEVTVTAPTGTAATALDEKKRKGGEEVAGGAPAKIAKT